MLPMFSEHSSGWKRRAASVRSSTVIPWPPPVVMFTTLSDWAVIAGQESKRSVWGRLSRLGISRMQVQDCRPGLRLPRPRSRRSAPV